MKKIFIIFIIAFLNSGVGEAQNFYVHINGHVMNTNGNTGIPNHSVLIKGDSGFQYNKTVLTDNSGYFADTFFVQNMQYVLVKVSTYDCNNILHDTDLYFNPSLTLASAVFHICSSAPVTCNAGFYMQTNYCNTCVSFIDTSTSSGTVISSWLWTFGDGSSAGGQNQNHCFGSTGSYTVCLTVTDSSNSCTSTFCDTVVIDDTYFVNSDFFYSPDTISGMANAYSFDDYSTGNANEWIWNFGDGTSSSLQSTYHLFPDSGSYDVCLISGNGVCYDTACKIVQVAFIHKYNLGGQVFAENYPIDKGKSYLYSVYNNIISLFDSMSFSVNGYFYYYYVPRGSYIIKVETTPNSALFGHYAPVYFGDVLKWGDASLINLTDSVYNADVNLSKTFPSAGIGVINGLVKYNGNPTPAVEIILFDLNNNVVDYSCTSPNGSFSFTNLAYGTYILYAEEAGKFTLPDTITLTATSPIYSNAEVFLFDQVQSDIAENNQPGMAKLEIFPNPSASVLNIKSGVDCNYWHCRVYNILGADLVNSVFTGNSFSIDVSSLSKGMYILKAENEKGSFVSKFIKE